MEEKRRLVGLQCGKRWGGGAKVGRGSERRKRNSSLLAKNLKKKKVAATMSLSVPQNGVKADNEPVIELFVKVRPVP